MTQPKNFGFGEEAALLKESARKFFGENFPTDMLHNMVAGDPTPERMSDCHWNSKLWQQMVDLGWTVLAIPEEQGGVGMPAVAVAGLVEELGRAAFPCPLLPTLSATYILTACGSGGAAALEEIADGSTATLVMVNQQGSWTCTDTPLVETEGKLSGTAWYVQEARKVDRLLVCARSDVGYSLYWVDSDTKGVTISPDAIVDLTRDQAHIHFDQVQVTPVNSNAMAVLEEAFPAIWTLYAADMVGAAEWQLQTTVEYVNARQQFDKPLGFFQAVKHPLVNVMVEIDEAKSLVYNAACAIDSEPEKARQYAHMAKASASDAAAFASNRSVQFHGGIGFTWECFLHLYFKRQKHSQILWGDGPWHRAKLADVLLGEVA